MATLLSLERYLPPYRYDQQVVTAWAREWLESGDGHASDGREGDGRGSVQDQQAQGRNHHVTTKRDAHAWPPRDLEPPSRRIGRDERI